MYIYIHIYVYAYIIASIYGILVWVDDFFISHTGNPTFGETIEDFFGTWSKNVMLYSLAINGIIYQTSSAFEVPEIAHATWGFRKCSRKLGYKSVCRVSHDHWTVRAQGDTLAISPGDTGVGRWPQTGIVWMRNSLRVGISNGYPILVMIASNDIYICIYLYIYIHMYTRRGNITKILGIWVDISEYSMITYIYIHT